MMNIPDSVFCPRCGKRVWLDVYKEQFEEEDAAIVVIGCPNSPCKCNIVIRPETGAVSDLAQDFLDV